MKLIIRNAKITAPDSPFFNQIVDMSIEDGIISKMGVNLSVPGASREIKRDNLHVSEGWFDCSVSFGEPGFEDRENIQNGLNTAARSGFTDVALQPNTFPVIDNQSQVRFVKSQAAGAATSLYPIGALTAKSEGRELAELFDMKNAGAVAFGDYEKSLEDSNLLKTALQYVQDFGGLVIAFAQDSALKGKGIANEGVVATRLGMKGIPALAEDIQIARNLFLLEYAGGKMHLPTISTAGAVKLIREAKAKGLQVSCSVSVHHLVFTDEKLEAFDTRYKVAPPLRTESDRLALIEGVKDGTIDMITSDHNPLDIEQKKLEFDLAKNGSIGLESAFGALMTVLPEEVIIRKLTSGKAIFGIEKQPIEEGKQASLTLYSVEGDWVFSKSDILSKSTNSAFLGAPLKGKIYGIIHNGKIVLNE